MAVVTAPLLSFSARGKIAGSLVYFPWKGMAIVREKVNPAQPRTTPQTTQRGYLTQAVSLIHTAQGLASNPLDADDVTAYAVYAGTLATIQTWFNAACRQYINQHVASKFGVIYRAGATTPGAGQLAVSLRWTKDTGSANDVTAGTIVYGTSPTAMVNSMAATIAASEITATITGLTAGTKYYWQFRSSAHDDFDGTRSGIYSGTPT